MQTYEVTEIFESFQGEGPEVGMQVIFIRMAGCNLDCRFCDTDHQTKEFLDAGAIVASCTDYPSSAQGEVVITGGEPLLQVDRKLLGLLHSNGYRISVETNGTVIPKDGVLDRIDGVLVVSPKSPRFVREVIEMADALKVVWPLPDGLSWPIVEEMVDVMRMNVNKPLLYLQPETPTWLPDESGTPVPDATNPVWLHNCRSAMDWAAKQNRESESPWRVLPQVHPWTGAR